MKTRNSYKVGAALLGLICIFSMSQAFGAHNFYINGQKNATITVNDSFTVSFDFSPGDSLANVLVWLDVNKNGVIDSLKDIFGFSSEHEGQPLVDGGWEDQDFQRNGAFLLTVTDFWSIADVHYIFVVYDNGGADMATLTVEQIQSSFSISGRVDEPKNQPFLMIEAMPVYNNQPGDDAGASGGAIEPFSLQSKLPNKKILSTANDDQKEFMFAALTDSNGDYHMFIPDDVERDWQVWAFDAFNLIPGYIPPEWITIRVNTNVNEVNFTFVKASALVKGTILDYLGQLPKDDLGSLLQMYVGARNQQTGMWIDGQVDSGKYRISVTEGNYDIYVHNVTPRYVNPYERFVNIASGDTLRDVNFVLYPTDATISGRVTQFGMNPVPNIEVNGMDEGHMFGYGYAQTDMNGFYVMAVSSLAPKWNVTLNMNYFPPEMIVEGGNMRQAAPGDQYVDFNIIQAMPEPKLEAIRDIPNDQGLQARVSWKNSSFDSREYHGMPILQYSVWRLTPRKLALDAIPTNSKEKKPAEKTALEVLSDAGKELPARMEDMNFIWDFITTVPAIKLPYYSYVSPTLGDSTAKGIYYSYFVVVAHCSDYHNFYYSAIDSGYSIDNLTPPAPDVLAEAVPMAVELKWNVNPHPDVTLYSIFRSTTPGFSPTLQNMIGQTSDTHFRDESVSNIETIYYRVAVEDDAHNRSISGEIAVTTSDVNASREKDVPETYQLGENFPDPFNPSTEIAFQIPKDGQVTIVIYNLLGERVKTLTNQFYSSGKYQLTWNGQDDLGRNAYSGIYFYRMEAGEFQASGKMILAR
ncbi:MAG: FlgD immunoglobulin-like domain containing protein [Candidatus Zhuqueibacterota bacterium]